MRTFTRTTKIGLHHTDAAGLLFVSQLFTLAYETFDAWLETLGVSVAWIIQESGFLFPYIHAEADFLEGMTVGQTVTIELSVEKMSRSSLTLNFLFYVGECQTACAKTVHVSMSKKTNSKIDLPEVLRKSINDFIQG